MRPTAGRFRPNPVERIQHGIRERRALSEAQDSGCRQLKFKSRHSAFVARAIIASASDAPDFPSVLKSRTRCCCRGCHRCGARCRRPRQRCSCLEGFLFYSRIIRRFCAACAAANSSVSSAATIHRFRCCAACSGHCGHIETRCCAAALDQPLVRHCAWPPELCHHAICAASYSQCRTRVRRFVAPLDFRRRLLILSKSLPSDRHLPPWNLRAGFH